MFRIEVEITLKILAVKILAAWFFVPPGTIVTYFMLCGEYKLITRSAPAITLLTDLVSTKPGLACHKCFEQSRNDFLRTFRIRASVLLAIRCVKKIFLNEI